MSVAAPQHQVAIPAGDPQALRAAAGRLSAAAAAMDGVTANLGASAEAACGGRCWVGPASDAFRAQVAETRAAARTGAGAFHDAAAALTRLAGELQAAQEQARRAQAAAVAAGGVIGSASQGLAALAASAEPDPLARSHLQRTHDDASAELTGAHAAMAHATERARVAGRAAAAALQAATQPATVPRPPERAGDPAAVAAWWAGLTPVQRLWLLANDPAMIGGLVGIPPAERDRANRRRLAQEQARLQIERAALAAELARLRADSNLLERWTPGWNRQEDALLNRLASLDQQLAQLAGLQAALAQVAAEPRNRLQPGDAYLLSFDPSGDGKAAIALGDPTRAATVGVVVPGMDNTLANIHNPLSNAVSLRRTSDDLAGEAVTDRTSVVAWLGYDTPNAAQVAFDDQAQAGAPELVRFVDDLRAAHTGTQPPRVTVLAHSYGTLVTGLAARQGLAADAVTLVGSPGVGAARASELGLPAGHVWAGRTPDDPIRAVFLTDPAARAAAEGFNRYSPVDVEVNGAYRFGPDPSLPAFGAQPIPLDARQHGHSDYYELRTEGIDALTRIMLGRSPHVAQVPHQVPQ
jgi:Alpha/beta hydrolase/Proteins of 100 residues with WXG